MNLDEKLANLEKSFQELSERISKDQQAIERIRGAYAILSELKREQDASNQSIDPV